MKIQPNTQQGFTLMELMITVAIVGIISAIAIPSYSGYVKKGKRAEAKVELLKIAQMQESYFTQNLSYAKDLSQLGFSLNTIASEKGFYNLTLGGALPSSCDHEGDTPVACTSYYVQATATGSQTGDSACTGFRIDNISRKYATGSGVTGYGVTTGHIAKAKACW